MPDPTRPAEAPLAGIKVLDFGRIIAGPFAGQLLADLGADVVKVERRGKGDETRAYDPHQPGSPGPSSLFLSLNRNKRSIALNLASPAGREIATRLAGDADVLLHNFRPGVMERLGLDYRTLARPRLIYCAMSGFGSRGPARDKAGNDLVIQAYSGLMSFMGTPGGEPVRCPVSISDFTGGLYATVGVLAMLAARERTGVGGEVETSLVEGLLGYLGPAVNDYLTAGVLPRRMGSANLLGQPNQAFETADGWVVVSAVSDRMWGRCSRALGGEEFGQDPRFATIGDRYAHRDELIAEVARRVLALRTDECVRSLEAAGVLCSPINGIDDLVRDRQIGDLGVIEKRRRGDVSAYLVRSPLTIDGRRPPVRRFPPAVGEHSAEVLAEAGFAESEIDAFAADGVIDLPAPRRVDDVVEA